VEVNATSLSKAAEVLAKTLHCELIAITLSEHGIFLAGHGESALFPTRVRMVVDVCGAGDAVIGVLALGHLMGASLGQMATLANAAGGVVCGTVGVSPVEVEAMRREIGS
jgi:bifunctional ADP-heptose synthase (sugar kinase/adenylyltransferase)